MKYSTMEPFDDSSYMFNLISGGPLLLCQCLISLIKQQHSLIYELGQPKGLWQGHGFGNQYYYSNDRSERHDF